MNRYALMALATCLLMAGDAPMDDMKALEGRWFGGVWTCNGAWMLVVDLKNHSSVLEIADSMATLRSRTGATERWSCTLDKTRVPMTMDLTVLDGPDKGKVRQGIYEIRPNPYGGYYLFLCIAEPGVRRPSEFVWDTGRRGRP
jgi:uncharacterized protein (TIGR03067 family)